MPNFSLPSQFSFSKIAIFWQILTKLTTLKGHKNSEKSKFQDLLHKIYRSHQYLSPKPKLALLDQ